MKELVPGMAVRVEHNARIVGLVEKNNPYWYEIEYPDGRREVVNVARLHWFADTCKATIDHDASIQVISNRLTASGAIDLYHWLRTHLSDFEAQIPTTTTPTQESEE